MNVDNAKLENVEDIYPLTPNQQGLLFHTLYSPESSVYVEQAGYDFIGNLDEDAFKSAWQQVVDRHPVLRSAFIWEGVDEPLQVVRQRVAVPWEVQDWRGFDGVDQQEKIRRFLRDDRDKNFQLSQAPLVRLGLFRLADDHYYFVWTFHHLLLDGWSLPRVVNEIQVFYGAFSRGETVALPYPRPYRDFIAWIKNQDLARAESYWRTVLRGFWSPTPLGLDRPDPSRVTEHGAGSFNELQLSRETTDTLQALARSNRLTLSTLVQGAWIVLLSRYSRSTDVVTGLTSSGRPAALAGVDSMVGHFVNTLPVRVEVPEKARLLPWLARLQAQLVELRDYEYCSLSDIQRWSEVPPGLPLFESAFAFENVPSGPAVWPAAGDLKVTRNWLFERTNDPMSVLAWLGLGERLSLRILYEASRFDPPTIERILGHLATLLNAIAEEPDRRIQDLPVLTEAESQLQLVTWNETQVTGNDIACLHRLFEAQVAKSPDVVAVNAENQQLTYLELNSRANGLAHQLRELGVGPEVLVGILMERSLAMVVAMVAVLKAGGAYVPLDPEYPRERLLFMLEDSGAPLLLTQSRLEDKFSTYRGRPVMLDEDEQDKWRKAHENLSSLTTEDNLAYMIYTSGSTGLPKGVGICHRAIASHCVSIAHDYRIDGDDRVLQFNNCSFDASVEQVFITLISGATLVLRGREVWSTDAFCRKVDDLDLSVIDLPPVYFQQWARAEAERFNPGRRPRPRLVIVGGDVLPLECLNLWRQSNAGAGRLLNAYGPTEATVTSTLYDTSNFEQHRHASGVPIGRPVANRRIYLLDSNWRAVPVGVAGELHIGGEHLARAYMRRPGLTGEKFVPDPFSENLGKRLYKTGDLARYLPDGNLEFVGRVDRQVKIRGFRIEPAEIEAVLRQYPAVNDAVVVVREDETGTRRLVAYVAADADRKEAASASDQWEEEHANSPLKAKLMRRLASDLRDYATDKLPDHMVPTSFVVMDAFPLTPNGKLDRQGLPEPDRSRLELEESFVPARTRAEETLVKIWAQVLGVAQVGVHDNFFRLGGDSILSTQIVSRCNEAGIRLTPRLIFEHPTIAELAAIGGASDAPLAEQGLITGSLPLTPIQSWFFERRLPDVHHFNQAVMLETREYVDPRKVKEVLEQLIRHHDALRLRFVREGDGWQQFHADLGGETPYLHVDLSAMEETERAQAIERVAGQVQAGLNLSEGPLLRVAQFDLGNSRTGRLLIVIHHLAVDGVSWRVLLEDLQLAYDQLSRGEPIQLPAKTTSFKSWSERLSRHALSEALDRELPYWTAESRKHLSPPSVDHAGGTNSVGSARTASVSLDEAQTAALLKEVPQAYNTQINDVLLTALCQAFRAWTGSGKLLVDVEGHGREDLFDDVDLSRTVGWFTTVYPVLLELPETGDIGGELKSIKEQLRSVPNRGIGYGLLRYLGRSDGLSETLGSLPEATVSFNYLGQTDQTLSRDSRFALAGESSGPMQGPNGQRSHLLDVNGIIVDNRLRVSFAYSSNVHRHQTIESLAQGFKDALLAIVRHCQSAEAGGHTPSDFLLAKIPQQALDELDQLLDRESAGSPDGSG